MHLFWTVLGLATRMGSVGAFWYLIANGRWAVILGAFAFAGVALAATVLVNVLMGIFWKELAYPVGLTTPGLNVLVSSWRLLLAIRIPQFFYGGLAYGLGLAVFLLFGDSSHGLERATLMMIGYDAAFTVPAGIPGMMSARDGRELVLSAEIFYAKMAFLALLIVHTITRLDVWLGAALLAVVILLLHYSVEYAVARRPWTDMLQKFGRG